MDEFTLSALFLCVGVGENHAEFAAEGLSLSVRGEQASQFQKAKEYQINISYVGDKPPHP